MNASAEPISSSSESKRPYYRPTTADQRKLLFRVYERTDSPREACAAAHVGIATFYYWRPRFEQGGYAALEEVRSHARHTFAKALPASTVQEVIAAKREHADWGRRRIADELRKGHGWQAVVSASEVRRILIEAGLWAQVSKPRKKVGRAPAMRTRQTRR
ncbi:MAG: helix-turn-helix domain-containing protein [Chloroflexi bacterium]|nr:helix-turn-helix domain-containing protein [Chloroflexota bacterium]